MGFDETEPAGTIITILMVTVYIAKETYSLSIAECDLIILSTLSRLSNFFIDNQQKSFGL